MSDTEKSKNEASYAPSVGAVIRFWIGFLRWLPTLLSLTFVLIIFFLVLSVFTTIMQTGDSFNNALGNTFNNVGTFFSSLGGLPEMDLDTVKIPEVEPFNELSRLTTMRFNYANIVTISTEMPGLLQSLYGSSLALLAVGHIEAGVDLSQMTQENIAYNPETKTMTLTIPAATLQTCFLNTQETKVVQQVSGAFATNQPRLNDESRLFALRQFRDKALETNILSDAQAKAESVVKNFTETLINAQDEGVTVVVVSQAFAQDPVLPAECR